VFVGEKDTMQQAKIHEKLLGKQESKNKKTGKPRKTRKNTQKSKKTE
jgi:hypothetical protein